MTTSSGTRTAIWRSGWSRSIAFTGAFTTAAGGSCGATPILLAAGTNCTQNIAFLPTAPGAASGSAVFGGTGVVPQSILLTGNGVQPATAVTLASNIAAPFAGQAIIFTATVQSTGVGTPTGSVTFLDGTTQIGVAGPTAGSASLSTTLSGGAHTITAVYAGGPGFTGNTSRALSQSLLDFNFTLGFSRSQRRKVRGMRPLALCTTLIVSCAAAGVLTGCESGIYVDWHNFNEISAQIVRALGDQPTADAA